MKTMFEVKNVPAYRQDAIRGAVADAPTLEAAQAALESLFKLLSARLGTYRGGNHIAIHRLRPNGTFSRWRIAIVTEG